MSQVKDIKEKAKKFLLVNKYQPLIVSAIMISFFVLLFIINIQLFNINPWLLFYSVFLTVAVYLLLAPLQISVTDYYMRSYNLNSKESFVLYDGYKKENFARALLFRLIRTGMALGCFILLIVPGVIVLTRTAFAYHIMKVSPKINTWDAMKRSNKLMQGHDFEMFKLALSFIGWWLLVIVSFGFVLIYVSPFYATSKSIFFRNVLLGKDDEDPNYLKDYASELEAIEKINYSGEIEEIERQIKLIELQKAMNNTQKKLKEAQGAYGNANAVNSMNNAVPMPNTKAKRSMGQEHIYMDAVGEVSGINTADRIEEVILPDIRSKNNMQFVTREVEIMENESFEDFKKRVERLRRERDEERRLYEAQQQAQFAQSAQGYAKTNPMFAPETITNPRPQYSQQANRPAPNQAYSMQENVPPVMSTPAPNQAYSMPGNIPPVINPNNVNPHGNAYNVNPAQANAYNANPAQASGYNTNPAPQANAYRQNANYVPPQRPVNPQSQPQPQHQAPPQRPVNPQPQQQNQSQPHQPQSQPQPSIKTAERVRTATPTRAEILEKLKMEREKKNTLDKG